MRSSMCSVVVAEPLTVAEPRTVAEPLTVPEPLTVAEPVAVLDALKHMFASCSMHSTTLRTRPQRDEDDGHN